MSESLGGPVKMYIAGLLPRDAKSEGWKRDLRICVFHQFPGDGATAGPTAKTLTGRIISDLK